MTTKRAGLHGDAGSDVTPADTRIWTYTGTAVCPGGNKKESWLMTDDTLTKALEQETAAVTAMQNGDPGPMIDFWADSDDITLFGAWGPIEKGMRP
jgi:hypothetical protein